MESKVNKAAYEQTAENKYIRFHKQPAPCHSSRMRNVLK